MENQQAVQYVQTTQPNQNFQPSPNVVYVQSPAPPRSDSGGSVGALVFALITLFCCPESFLCTIPSCICAIVALNDTSDSSRTLTKLSFFFTGLFYIVLIISVVVFLIWFFAVFKPAAEETLAVFNDQNDDNHNQYDFNSFLYNFG